MNSGPHAAPITTYLGTRPLQHREGAPQASTPGDAACVHACCGVARHQPGGFRAHDRALERRRGRVAPRCGGRRGCRTQKLHPGRFFSRMRWNPRAAATSGKDPANRTKQTIRERWKPFSTIVKGIKRAMAGEYSCEFLGEGVQRPEPPDRARLPAGRSGGIRMEFLRPTALKSKCDGMTERGSGSEQSNTPRATAPSQGVPEAVAPPARRLGRCRLRATLHSA